MFKEANRFSKYLASLGFPVSMPEPTRVPLDYVPYIFSEDEFKRIINADDNLQGNKRITKSSFLFPDCGLRLNNCG
jgi:hypothetical protein